MKCERQRHCFVKSTIPLTTRSQKCNFSSPMAVYWLEAMESWSRHALMYGAVLRHHKLIIITIKGFIWNCSHSNMPNAPYTRTLNIMLYLKTYQITLLSHIITQTLSQNCSSDIKTHIMST